ncbi:hypothetical protein L2E82_32937 [Cichorium intybus]|uniref:Uncharacterized protein n=1 Tax=Cichorium intybus TaxID=13427 RepID=A0ACB9BIF3_CICIN|nr:hypothetical protein L2E82_32937 [Cichorium intybus]
MISIGKNQGVDSGTGATTIVARPYAASSLTYSLLRRNPNGTGCLIPPSNTIAQAQVDSEPVRQIAPTRHLYLQCYVKSLLKDSISNKNVVSWNSLISGCMKNGLPKESPELFHEMKLSTIKPDMVTVSNILDAFFQTGKIYEAQKLFKEVEDKDVISWTTMIVGHVQNGKEEDALMLFSEMLMSNIKPDKFKISTMIRY